jgi:hypothetical protein
MISIIFQANFIKQHSALKITLGLNKSQQIELAPTSILLQAMVWAAFR